MHTLQAWETDEQAKSWGSLRTGGSCIFAYFKLKVIGGQLGHLGVEPWGWWS